MTFNRSLTRPQKFSFLVNSVVCGSAKKSLVWVPVPISVKTKFWFERRLSQKTNFCPGPGTKVFLPGPGPGTTLLIFLNYFDFSLELKNFFVKFCQFFLNVFVENLIKRILLTMKACSNPIDQQIDQSDLSILSCPRISCFQWKKS